MNIGYLIGRLFGNGIAPTVWAMIAVGVLPLLLAMIGKYAGGFRPTHNANPRAFWAAATGLSARANAAQANSYESLPLFLAAVLMAMYTFVPQQVVNGLAWAYVGTRVVFAIAYLGNLPVLRSVAWCASFACVITLFVVALRVL
ncbi:MAG: MAPEG family protein [Moraxella sp.]|nr:MAPEG family protein [Moraxella sp.]